MLWSTSKHQQLGWRESAAHPGWSCWKPVVYGDDPDRAAQAARTLFQVKRPLRLAITA